MGELFKICLLVSEEKMLSDGVRGEEFEWLLGLLTGVARSVPLCLAFLAEPPVEEGEASRFKLLFLRFLGDGVDTLDVVTFISGFVKVCAPIFCICREE